MARKITQRREYIAAIHVLRDIRISKGYTAQEGVSQSLGRYSSYVTKIETGERRLDVVELMELLAFYGVSLTKFEKLYLKAKAAKNGRKR